jgi:hypothetical protein
VTAAGWLMQGGYAVRFERGAAGCYGSGMPAAGSAAAAPNSSA